MTQPHSRASRPVSSLVLGLLALTAACEADLQTIGGTESEQGGVVAVSGGALLVVGSATLVPGDAALRQRMQGLGLTVTVKTAAAVTAADATNKVVLISESVLSGDVNTKLRNVSAPVMTLEPLLFDDLGLTAATAADNGTQTNQTAVLMLGAPRSLAANVSVTLTTSPQPFGWGRPASTATIVATIAGDPTHATIFSYERGTTMVGLTAPGRRVGWFAGAAAPTAFNANAWSLFDAAVAWAAAGVGSVACMTDADCPMATHCVANQCGGSCPVGQIACGATCVDPNTSNSNCGNCGVVCAMGQTCQSGTCRLTCSAGQTACGATCVDLNTSSSNCGGCGIACFMGQTCQMGTCRTPSCPVGQTLCGATCVDLTTSNSNCGNCGVACATGQTCQMATCR